MADETVVQTNVVPFPRSKTLSDADIEEHTKLVASYRATKQHQRVIARRLRPAPTSECTDDMLNALPIKTKTRIVLRNALKKALKGQEDSPRSALMQEYAYLDKKQRSQREKLMKLEKHVLTAQPTSPSEARRFMRFLANLVVLQRNINKHVLSDALQRCAAATETAGPRKNQDRIV